MQLRGRNLSNGTRGEDVRVLHRELLKLGYRLIPNLEINPGIFGPFTLAAVLDFQKKAGLPATGVVDARTAAAINEAGERPVTGGGDLDGNVDDDVEMRIFGIVRWPTGQPAGGLKVRAVDRDLRTEELLGEADTGIDGRYVITYTREQFKNKEKLNADVVVTVRQDPGPDLYRTPLYFNVPAQLELNLTIGDRPYPGPSEWEVLNTELNPLLGELKVRDLRQDAGFQDITFLESESGISASKIIAWVFAYRLAAKTTAEGTAIPPDALFAFHAQGQPTAFEPSLMQDLGFPDRVVLLEDRLLRMLANMEPSLQRSTLETAVARNIVPDHVTQAIPIVLDMLRKIKGNSAAKGTLGEGQGTVGQLFSLVAAAEPKRAEFLSAWASHRGPVAAFWQEADRILTPDVAKQVRLSFELGSMTRNHVPLVREFQRRFSTGAIKSKRDLAKLNLDGWIQIFNSNGPDGQLIGIPSDISSQNDYAVLLDQQIERIYPTATFGAKVDRSPTPPVAGKKDFVLFLDNNPNFFLDTVRFDHYVEQNTGALTGIADPVRLRADVQTAQRVFRLAPAYKTVDAVRSLQIDSAQQIYFMGRTQFVSAVAAKGISEAEGQAMYRRAESSYAQVLTLFGDYNRDLAGDAPAAVPPLTLDAATTAQLAVLPNLRTLFGSNDYCECTECRSVYSASAYFVDVLRFLGQRQTNGTGTHRGKNVRQVLFERRPDLGEIELSCDNTNTPLPYIDLANEILEDAVSAPVPFTVNVAETDLVAGTIQGSVHDKLVQLVPVAKDARVYAADSRNQWVVRDSQHAYKLFKVGTGMRLLPTRQTFRTAAELRANPEYTNIAAYTKLRGEVFPLTLPFDLFHLQTLTYLTHLGVSQPQLLELFQREPSSGTFEPTAEQLDAAWLGLHETERQILDGSLTGKQSWDYWGLAQTGNDIPDPDNPADPTQNVKGSWTDVLSHVHVLMHRAGLTYRELRQLLEMKYVNPEGKLSINDTADPNAANCDVSKFLIRNLDDQALDRMHRFIRLWRRVGCAMWELDILLPRVNPDRRIPPAVLQRISRLNRLQVETGLEWRVLYSLYNDIDHNVYVNRLTDGTPVQTLYERLFRNQLVDALSAFPASPAELSGAISARVPGILAALRISESDLDLILRDLGLTPASTLNAASLSAIHRTVALAQAASLTVDHFLRLKRLRAASPFDSEIATRRFLEFAKLVAASPFSVAELDYLLAHRFSANSGVALEDRTIVTVVTALRQELQKIDGEIRRQGEETKEAYVRRSLGQLTALAKDADQTAALAVIDDTYKGTDRNALIDRFFAGVLDLTEAKTKLAPLAAGLPPADRQAAIDARFDYVQGALEAFLLRTQKEVFLYQKTAEVFALDAAVAKTLLTTLLTRGVSVTLLAALNDPRLLERNADGTYRLGINETNFPRMYEALRILHKVALLIVRLHMSGAEVVWWLATPNATVMGWLHPNELPVDAAGAAVPIAKWTALQQFFDWKAGLPQSQLTAIDFTTILVDIAQPLPAAVSALARLTGWESADIDALIAAFRWTKESLRASANLVRLAEAMRVLRRLGVNAARALQWAVAAPDAAVAESLKQTIKSKYDLTQWQQILKPLQDTFRERKREALVSWLVAHPDTSRGQNWSDANGLYSYFLIDVEMSACMLTSRLKQAAASAQLFVQRCLLNLEADIVASADLDDKWKQWTWMKRYRVWEANRKVFLYPENWIEPELRDEKSPFFKDLENELLQSDITTDTAEQAFMNYLEKLETIANLEIRATYNEVIGADQSILHVVGRTRSSTAPEYYYRKRINGARWTPWEKAELDIQSDHLVIGVHNRRVYLLWPQFIPKAVEGLFTSTPNAGQPSVPIPSPDRYWETHLYWSELKKGKWTAKVLSNSSLTNSGYLLSDPSQFSFRTNAANGVRTRLFSTTQFNGVAPVGYQYFDKAGRSLTATLDDTKIEHLIAPYLAYYQNNLLTHFHLQHFFYYSMFIADDPYELANSDYAHSIRVLRKITPNETHTVIESNAREFKNAGSFFVWDPSRTYFVDYAVTQPYSSPFAYIWYGLPLSSFRFYVHYHPFVELFIRELNVGGIKGLLNRRIQVDPAKVLNDPNPFQFSSYDPDPSNVARPLPEETVDFNYNGAYAPYNWELFFHAPFLIANKLASNQRFEEALSWFHFIFDPTNPETTTPNPDTPQQKFWITKPFYETTKKDYLRQKIENILLAIARNDPEAIAQVNEWRNNPFNPHLIARMRTVAYQKNVVIKYIQTLIAWGDQLFRQDTIESINEATQLYILAASILGPRPRNIPKNVPNPVKTFYQLEKEGIDAFGNVLKEIENLLPAPAPAPAIDDDVPDLPRLDVLYFCIPNNDKILGLWDTVGDRLFKIRHCMNIAGVVRQLPLFEPPIDPALLVKAAAAGVDLGAVLSDISAPLPLYRFSFMIERALELCNELKALGNAMLSALEKRDAEAFALLRSRHEIATLQQARVVRQRQIEEALRTMEGFQAARKVVEERKAYFDRLDADGLSGWEIASLALTGGAIVSEIVATVLSAAASGTSLIPTISGGGAGFGGSPVVVVSFGGGNVGGGLGNAANVVKSVSTILQMASGMTSTVGGYMRRGDEWAYQARLAAAELPQVDKQIAAAQVRQRIAEAELVNHDRQTERLQEQDEFLRTKFTNQELFDWTVAQLSTVYFQSYQLAYDVARRAERCLRYELGLKDSSYVQFGHWDSLRKGLLSGERLYYDLKRMEAAYYEQNRREYELTKHVSLALLDPVALLKLRQNGECHVHIPETVFDMDYPGHYFRRLKSVALSIPCTVGPYTTLACTLTLTSNSLRTDSTLSGGQYTRNPAGDLRFRDEIAAIQSMTTSNGQNDRGLFELSFRDERYLPFEGAGAISTWHLKLNGAFPQFDLKSISDVILHLDYTAREGGELLRSKAADEFNKKLNDLALAEDRKGLLRIFDLRRELPDKWQRFLRPPSPADDQAIVLDDLADRLPYFTRAFATKKVRTVEVVARMKDTQEYAVQLSPLAELLPLKPGDPAYTGLHRAVKTLAAGSEIPLSPWTLKIQLKGAADFKSLPPDAIEELLLMINYSIA